MRKLVTTPEKSRLSVSKPHRSKKKSKLGQFFTPQSIAQFMAGLFVNTSGEICRLLDAGAGFGALSAAFIQRWVCKGLACKKIEIDAFEIDKTLLPHLEGTFEGYKNQTHFSLTVRNTDFISAAVDSLRGNLFSKPLPKYTHAILNPPYKKIRSDSAYRTALRQIGIETGNLYSAFVALSLALLENGGQLVAIIPRSFCNGPYYYPFRKFLLERAAIRHIHLFDSRTKAFKNDNVLQENVIIMLERGGFQGDVKISTSSDDNFDDMETRVYPYDRIVLTNDARQFIHIPTSFEENILNLSNSVQNSLDDIGVNVSTGPVVDFRLKEFLCDMPTEGTVPLLYPGHFMDHKIQWPKFSFKKANAIKHNEKTEKWFYPNGYYCIVRRFSSKEEKRRIVASVVRPDNFKDMKMLAFENHLNVFHQSRNELPESLAYGLAVFLNSTAVDDAFRRFNGHTQVNATDLKSMKYPSRQVLISLGEWAIQTGELTQASIDEKIENLST